MHEAVLNQKGRKVKRNARETYRKTIFKLNWWNQKYKVLIINMKDI